MEIKELVCSHCGKTGHEVEACYKLIGYPEGETLDDDGSSSPTPADHYDDDDDEVLAEEQQDRPRRNGQPEEGEKAAELPAVDLVDRSDVHGRLSSRQKNGILGDQPTVDSVDRSERHGGPFVGQKVRLQGDEETVDRDESNGRSSPRQKGGNEEPSQTVDPVDRSTDGGRPSSSQQETETLGRGQRERRPNVRLADYVTHVAGPLTEGKDGKGDFYLLEASKSLLKVFFKLFLPIFFQLLLHLKQYL
ncbi:unnamed protein product [Cuscuta campestris]|uniref:CCHC-type domain-containing protein n=1 Tax=Cuscuta campestris TaxID=132261 RepID=A0A484MM48_9ASTE|nr:unnamed protein product [Cuscuta campestris]